MLKQFQDAYNEALNQLTSKDPQLVANLAGARLSGNRFTLHYCAHPLTVEVIHKIYPHPGHTVNFNSNLTISDCEKILILQYLAGASGLPERGRWLSFIDLPGGVHHHGPFVQEALVPLANKFELDAQGVKNRAQIIGGKPTSMGDLGFIIPAFPKLNLGIVLWSADDEFPPRASILFDEAAPTYLSTASLYVLGIEVSRRLRGDL